jgi:hypothetical protein
VFVLDTGTGPSAVGGGRSRERARICRVTRAGSRSAGTSRHRRSSSGTPSSTRPRRRWRFGRVTARGSPVRAAGFFASTPRLS